MKRAISLLVISNFFALSGHICKLCEPKQYDDWDSKWEELELPMMPSPFKVGVLRPDKVKRVAEAVKAGQNMMPLSSAPIVMLREMAFMT